MGFVDSVELVNEILSSANANKDLLINLQHQHLRPGITYEFSLVLVNFLERTNVADILVSKVDTYIPQVLIQGAQFSRTILRTEQVRRRQRSYSFAISTTKLTRSLRSPRVATAELAGRRRVPRRLR